MPTFETPDGLTLYFEDTGTGTPILFVHEFGGDYRSWHLQVPALSQRFRCITPSARVVFTPQQCPKTAPAMARSIRPAMCWR